MRKTLICALAALALLGGCAQFQSAVNWVTSTSTTPQEVNTVAAASNLYVAAARAADAFVKTDKCTPALCARIASVSHLVRLDLDDALSAEQAGDSAKVKLALDAFNQAYPDFLSILQQNGVTP